MAKNRHLRNAPITEAIVDFRVSLPRDFDPDRLREAKQRLGLDYPHSVERKGRELFVEFTGEQPASAGARDHGLQGVWLKSEDQRTIAQFRVDGFTLNRLRPYTSWGVILTEAMRGWDVYVAVARPDGVTRVALRYINHIRLPGPGVELDSYLLAAPRLPKAVPEILSSFATRVVMEHPDRQASANISQVLEPGVESAGQSLLLDIDVYRVGDFGIDPQPLRAILEDLHSYKNDIFFGSLTDQLVETFA
jgi:uncharacterized protein (TIGR04255 family)